MSCACPLGQAGCIEVDLVLQRDSRVHLAGSGLVVCSLDCDTVRTSNHVRHSGHEWSGDILAEGHADEAVGFNLLEQDDGERLISRGSAGRDKSPAVSAIIITSVVENDAMHRHIPLNIHGSELNVQGKPQQQSKR